MCALRLKSGGDFLPVEDDLAVDDVDAFDPATHQQGAALFDDKGGRALLAQKLGACFYLGHAGNLTKHCSMARPQVVIDSRSLRGRWERAGSLSLIAKRNAIMLNCVM